MPCKLLNTREIAIDFETTKIGSTPIAAVELWATLDGGKTWSCTDRTTNIKSPFRTRLGSEGAYGFKVVFENALGLRSVEPKVGDSPDVVVELDLQSPRVSAIAVTPIPSESDKVQLSWTITDKFDDPRSTKLEYSTDGCEWHSIDLAGLRRDGERCDVNWSIPAGVPSQVQFRVTARDLAGNQTISESQNKTTIDLVVPEGKITGARSQRTEPEIGPMPRVIVDGLSSQKQIRLIDPSAYSGGRSIPALLSDTDWKPSTATPESYRLWDDQPRDDMWYWGRPPYPGIVFRY